MAIDIGRIGYQEYSKVVNNKTYDGKDMPQWEDLPKKIQDAWRYAAVAIVQYWTMPDNIE